LTHFGQLHKPPPIIALMAHVVLSSWRANAPTTITLQWSKMNYWVIGPCGDCFVYSSLLDTIHMTDVWHNIICKTFSWKKKTIYWYLSKHLKIELNWVTSYKYTIQGVTLCILIPQLLKFLNFEFQTDGPQFFSKINKYATKKCQYQSIIICIQLGW